MEKRKFVSDLIFVQGINILIKAVWILMIDRAVQDLLPPEDYGRYFSLFSFTILFIIVLDLGINNLNARSVAADPGFFKTNFLGFIVAKLILSVLFLIVVFVVAGGLGYSEVYMSLLWPLVAFQIFISLNQYLRSNISGLHFFKLDGFLAVADRLLVVVICGSWLTVDAWNYMLTIRNFILIQLLGSMFTTALGFAFNLKYLGKMNTAVRLPDVTKLLRKSLPYALLAALMAFFTRIDAVMIDSYLGEVEADRYAMAYRLLDAGNMIAVLLAGMLLPIFSKLIVAREEIHSISRLSFQILVVPAVCLAVMIYVYAVDILSLMYPNKLAILAPEAFVWLMCSFVSICVIYIYGTLLTAAADMKYLNILAATCAIANVLLNSYLIPVYGVAGAAMATFLTQTAFASACFLRSKRWGAKFTMTRSDWLTTLFVFGFAGLFLITKQFFQNAFVHISFGVVATLSFVVSTGVVSNETLKRMSRRKTQEPSDI